MAPSDEGAPGDSRVRERHAQHSRSTVSPPVSFADSPLIRWGLWLHNVGSPCQGSCRRSRLRGSRQKASRLDLVSPQTALLFASRQRSDKGSQRCKQRTSDVAGRMGRADRTS